MEDCTPHIGDDSTTDDDEDTATFTTPTTTTVSTSSSTSSGFLDSSLDDEYSCSEHDVGQRDIFPIMQLPTEIRSRILNLLPQRLVPCLRLVCRSWKEEIDQFYEFSLNIYDTTTNLNAIRRLRCRECTIWKLTAKLEPGPLFGHPAYLKGIKVYGPMSAENLSSLITTSTNLEHLTLTRRANYPWILNLKDTPGLAGLNELRYLRLNSEEHVSIHSRVRSSDNNASSNKSPSLISPPPMMDCYFPKLKHFEILKRFAVWQYSHYVTSILKFVARHCKTLRNIELDLIPLSCIAVLDQESSEDSSDSSDDGRGRPHHYFRNRRSSAISSDEIGLQDLCSLNLSKFCVTTKGSDCDIFIWSSILEQQKGLTELRFDWLCRDPRAEIRARVTGFPWIHFQLPVEQSAETLVHVELASLSMFHPAGGGGGSPRRVAPFDLAIFRNCRRLKSLILRCRENHAKLTARDLAPDQEGIADEDINPEGDNPAPASSSTEVLLMINGSELPPNLEQLEIFRFPMLTSDLTAMLSPTKLPNIRKLFLHECGKSGEFGVSAKVLVVMGELKSLKFLEVIGFNDRGGERRSELEGVFQAIGLPYEGQDTWLEFSDGSTSAHESLKVLINQGEELLMCN